MSLSTWLQALPSVNIIVVDWGSSDSPLDSFSSIGIELSPRLRIISPEESPKWHFTRALNFGLRHVRTAFILKLDADHMLNEKIADFLEMDPYSFQAGNYPNGEAGSPHTAGAILSPLRALQSIGGWDERIETYGWDDSDLYERLSLTGLTRSYFRSGLISHLDHGDALRTSLQSLKNPRISTRLNRAICLSSSPWTGWEVNKKEIPQSPMLGVLQQLPGLAIFGYFLEFLGWLQAKSRIRRAAGLDEVREGEMILWITLEDTKEENLESLSKAIISAHHCDMRPVISWAGGSKDSQDQNASWLACELRSRDHAPEVLGEEGQVQATWDSAQASIFRGSKRVFKYRGLILSAKLAGIPLPLSFHSNRSRHILEKLKSNYGR